MIRVLHSVSNMDRAGIETMLMNYYRYMDRNEVQFDFLCNKKKPGAYDDEIKSLGGRIFHTPGLNPTKYFQYQKYMKMLFAKHPEYKILHGHNGAFAVYSLHAAKKSKIPVRIYHCHGASLIHDLKYPLKLVCMKFLDKNYNHRWTCGEAAARFYYGDKIADSRQYRLITNAIDVEKFIYDESVRMKMRRQYNLEHKKVIGHVGRFMTQKNHTFLLDVFACLHEKEPSTTLVLLGDGELMEEMKKKAQELNVVDSVLFVGNVNNANEWYQAFDLFILPSIYEGLPVVGIEAQAAGLPCVFSTKVTKEVSITDHTEFLDLGDSCAVWARKILEMLQKCAQRQNEYDAVTAANYNIKVESKKLQQLYVDLYNGENIL